MDSSPAFSPTDILGAWQIGHHAYAMAIVLVMAVALVRRYFGTRVPWFHTDAGSATLVLLGSFGGALATALSTGIPMTLGIGETALGVAVTAAGGYTLIKQVLITPILCKWEAKAGPTGKKVLGAVLWIFCQKNDPNAKCATGAISPLTPPVVPVEVPVSIVTTPSATVTTTVTVKEAQ